MCWLLIAPGTLSNPYSVLLPVGAFLSTMGLLSTQDIANMYPDVVPPGVCLLGAGVQYVWEAHTCAHACTLTVCACVWQCSLTRWLGCRRRTTRHTCLGDARGTLRPWWMLLWMLESWVWLRVCGEVAVSVVEQFVLFKCYSPVVGWAVVFVCTEDKDAVDWDAAQRDEALRRVSTFIAKGLDLMLQRCGL